MSNQKIYFPAGTLVKITKTNIAPGQTSAVKVGTVMKGHVKEDIKEGNSIDIVGDGNTTTVTKITETSSKDLVVETNTSTYFVQVI